MFNRNCEITLVSQLLDSIDHHLKLVHLPMEQYEMSEDDDDELWLSDHRSIFSSYGSHCQKIVPSFRNSQYEGFHWDLYENHNYHHLAFEPDQQPASLSEWSMRLNSNTTEDDIDNTTSSSSSPDRPRTSWHEIKTKSIHHSCSSSTNTSNSDHYSPNPLTLYRLFQRTKSQQHPCRLYENFSDKSMCDSSTSSSSSSYLNTNKQKHQIPLARIKLKSPTTFSQIKLNNQNSKEQSKTGVVDQCLQTSIIDPIVTCSKSPDRLLNNPSQSSSTPRHSLPNLDFLTYYAKENPPPLSTRTKHICTAMKSPLIEPLSLAKKGARTVFYCTIKIPNRPTTFHPSLEKARTFKEIKRIKNIKTSPTTISAEDIEAFSSICSSTSSSGYFSNCSRHMQTPLPSYPLKSCLKRTKTEEIREDLFTLAVRSPPHPQDTSKHRRYSAPTTSSSHQQNSSYRTKNKLCTLSEHDLRAKKSVSFCNEIARRLITPSTSPKDRYNYGDLIPRESLIDSPPSEFNLSDDGENEDQLINFIENVPEDIAKPLAIKHENDKYLIDVFANTILHILEIKCSDPKSYYLNNLTNQELERTLHQDLCPLLREILEDGLRQNSNFLFSKKIHLWRLIELTTPTTGHFHEAKMKAQIGLSSTVVWIERFNSFIYQLLNLHELASWLTYFLSHRTLLNTYYESWALALVNINNDLFENIANQLEKLSPLSFRLKYTILLPNQRSSLSILPKKFHVRTWLRDRKTQVKISPEVSQIPPKVSIRRKFNSIPISKRH